MKVIPREVWNAGPDVADKMGTPIEGLFVHHTVGGAPRTRRGERAEMRNLQAVARSRGFVDISYSFVVFPSGRIYEGRGKHREGAHTLGFNDTAYAASCAGNYDASRPSDKMIAALRWLRRDYLNLKDRPLRPHSAVYGTACPGRYLRARLNEL